jgi:hypothetical protein
MGNSFWFLINVIGVFMFIAALFFSFAFAAGGVDGGGGKGVVCRNPDQSIQSVELLDLWEARVLYRRQVVPLGETIADQVRSAANALKRSIYYGIIPTVETPFYFRDENDVLKTIMNLTTYFDNFNSPDSHVAMVSGISLSLTEDSYEIAKPSNCEIEQIVVYRSFQSGTDIWISKDLLDKMDETNKAALIAHEAFYGFAKYYLNETNSIRIRRAIGYVFSGKVFDRDIFDLPLRRIKCEANSSAGKSEFYFFDVGDATKHKIVSVPTILMNKPAIGFFSATIHSSSSLDKFLDPHVCDNYIIDYESAFPLGGAGPINYDNNDIFSLRCELNASGIKGPRYYFKQRNERNTWVSQLLQCKILEN